MSEHAKGTSGLVGTGCDIQKPWSKFLSLCLLFGARRWWVRVIGIAAPTVGLLANACALIEAFQAAEFQLTTLEPFRMRFYFSDDDSESLAIDVPLVIANIGGTQAKGTVVNVDMRVKLDGRKLICYTVDSIMNYRDSRSPVSAGDFQGVSLLGGEAKSGVYRFRQVDGSRCRATAFGSDEKEDFADDQGAPMDWEVFTDSMVVDEGGSGEGKWKRDGKHRAFSQERNKPSYKVSVEIRAMIYNVNTPVGHKLGTCTAEISGATVRRIEDSRFKEVTEEVRCEGAR